MPSLSEGPLSNSRRKLARHAIGQYRVYDKAAKGADRGLSLRSAVHTYGTDRESARSHGTVGKPTVLQVVARCGTTPCGTG